jgi:hypothetical protein
MNEKFFTSTKLARPAILTDSWKSMCYVSTWDAFIAQSIAEYSRVFRDGTKVKFGKPSGSYIMLGRVKGFPAYYSGSTYKVYGAYEINGIINPNEILNPDWNIGYSIAPSVVSAGFIDDIRQVYLHQASNNWIDIYNLATGVKIAEIVHNAGSRFYSLAWAGQERVAGLCPNGTVMIMNYLGSPQLLTTGLIDSFKIGAFDCTYETFFTIGTDYIARVYSGDAPPTTLSAPAFDPATVHGLMGNLVSVRLTGYNSRVFPNYRVSWDLVSVGSGVIGSLEKTDSLTDEDGYAYNRYIGPDDGSTGQCKITAEVTI